MSFQPCPHFKNRQVERTTITMEGMSNDSIMVVRTVNLFSTS